MLTSEKVTNTAFALPNGLSVMRRLSVPWDPDGPDGAEVPEGPDGDPLHPKAARTAPAARTDFSRMICPPAPEGQEVIHSAGSCKVCQLRLLPAE
jgi:hypothetical protein